MTDGEMYRSATTGDLGRMLTEDGKEWIVLDRPMHVVKRPYKDADWIKEDEHRPLLPQQIGLVLFQTEKYLLIAVGDPAGHKMDWATMTNLERADYMSEDSHHALVRRLHEGMRDVLEPLGE